MRDCFVDIKLMVVFQSLEVYQRRRDPVPNRTEAPPDLDVADLLTRLMEEHWKTVGPLFGNNHREAAGEVIRYRNYIVHRVSDPIESPSYSETIYWLTQKLMFLMKACLLTELGISVEDQVKFFRRNQTYLHILGLSGK